MKIIFPSDTSIVLVIFPVLIVLMLCLLVGELFGHVRKMQPWADPKIVKVI